MTEQKTHYDEHIARYRTLSERYGFSPPDLTESVENHKTYYLICRIIYAIEDSLSFLFGNIKLYFSIVASYYQRSDSGAGDDLHTSLQSLPDLLIILGLGIPLVLIQVLGAYLADSPDLNKNKFKYFFVKVLAPYLRDILQGIKWAYKGMRSALNMVFYFMGSHKELILKILFPLSIAIAVVSLLNRIFLRSLRNVRKIRQSENRNLSIETLEQGHVIKLRQEMPTEEKNLIKLKKSLVYVPTDSEPGCKIYYVNAKGVAKEINFSVLVKQNISAMIKRFQSDNIRYHLEPEFISQDIKELVFLDEIPENYARYHEKIIFLTDEKLDKKQRLIKIDAEGNHTYDDRSEYFIQALTNVIKNKSALNLYSYQLDKILKHIEDNDSNYQTYELGLSLEEWCEIKGTKTPQTLSKWLIFWCFASVILSALIDGTYFYIGTMFMAAFNPAAFIAMMVMASIMLIVCLVARIYEEYNYQKAFNISQIEIDLNIQKTELNILGKVLQQAINSDNLPKMNELLPRYKCALILYHQHKKTLEANIRISSPEAFLKGLKNGLSAQGVISALMFVGVTIMILTGTTCPPAFILGMTAFSIVLLIRSIYRYMQSYAEYKKIDTPLPDLELNEIPVNFESVYDASEAFYSLKDLKEQQEQFVIAQPPNLYEEENSEVIRLGCSGFSKWQKNFGECTLGEPRNGEDWWLTVTSLGISGVVMWAFIERGKYKMFSSAGDNPNIVANEGVTLTSDTGKIRFYRQPSGELAHSKATLEQRGSPTKSVGENTEQQDSTKESQIGHAPTTSSDNLI